MKTHQPWQPYIGNSPLFNPFSPAARATTLDHFDLIEEEVDETEASADEMRDEPENPAAPRNRD